MALTIGQHLAALQAEHTEALTNGDNEKIKSLLLQYYDLLNSAPRDPGILFLAATCHLQLGHNGLAINLYETCLQRAPKSPEIWNNLGSAWKAELKNSEAERCYKMAAKLKPDCTDYYNNLSTLHINEGSAKLGIPAAEKAIALDPNNARAHWNYSLLLLETGQWSKGFSEYDAGILSGDRPNRLYNDAELYIGTRKTPNDKVVIYGEQGLGDEIMYLSALQDALDDFGKDNVIIDCHPRLEGVVARTFPGVELHPTRKKNTLDWLEGRKLDYRLPIGSLFRWYRGNGVFPRETYLTPDPVRVEKWKKRLKEAGPGPYVGIGWAGGSKRTHSPARSFQLTPLKPFLSQAVTWVSLQYTPEAAEKLDRFHKDSGIRIHHWPDAVDSFDYDETIALVAALDLVIAVNTTAVHVAGAVGTPCWTMTPDRCAWRYSNGGDEMSFYGPWVRQYRENNNWPKTVKKIAEDLKRWMGYVEIEERA